MFKVDLIWKGTKARKFNQNTANLAESFALLMHKDGNYFEHLNQFIGSNIHQILSAFLLSVFELCLDQEWQISMCNVFTHLRNEIYGMFFIIWLMCMISLVHSFPIDQMLLPWRSSSND